VRGFDLRSRSASRFVLHCCGASSGGVAPSRPVSCPRSLRKRVGPLLRLTPSHVVAARTSAARACSVAPRLLSSLCTRGWAVRGSDLRSRVASRHVLLRRVCGWATWRPDSCPRSTREGRRRAAPLKSRTSSRLAGCPNLDRFRHGHFPQQPRVPDSPQRH